MPIPGLAILILVATIVIVRFVRFKPPSLSNRFQATFLVERLEGPVYFGQECGTVAAQGDAHCSCVR